MDKDGTIYNNTRYYLDNKFSSQEGTSQNEGVNSLRETGNIYSLENQEIPDILTGEIWKVPNKKPDADTKVASQHTGEPMTKVQIAARPKSLNPHGTTSIIKPEIQKFDEAEYVKNVFHHERGENHNVLFGHGLEINEVYSSFYLVSS